MSDASLAREIVESAGEGSGVASGVTALSFATQTLIPARIGSGAVDSFGDALDSFLRPPDPATSARAISVALALGSSQSLAREDLRSAASLHRAAVRAWSDVKPSIRSMPRLDRHIAWLAPRHIVAGLAAQAVRDGMAPSSSVMSFLSGSNVSSFDVVRECLEYAAAGVWDGVDIRVTATSAGVCFPFFAIPFRGEEESLRMVRYVCLHASRKFAMIATPYDVVGYMEGYLDSTLYDAEDVALEVQSEGIDPDDIDAVEAYLEADGRYMPEHYEIRRELMESTLSVTQMWSNMVRPSEGAGIVHHKCVSLLEYMDALELTYELDNFSPCIPLIFPENDSERFDVQYLYESYMSDSDGWCFGESSLQESLIPLYEYLRAYNHVISTLIEITEILKNEG